MKKSDIRFSIKDYCSKYEIDITEEELDQATEEIAENVEYWEEYWLRCGIHATNLDIILDNYFDSFE